MNKIFTSVCLFAFVIILAYSSAFSQGFPTDKGSKIVAGGFSYTSSGGDLNENSDGDRDISIDLSSSVSYFLSPGFALGANFLFSRNSQGDNSVTMWGIGPQLSYFIGGNQAVSTVKGTTYPFLTVSFVYVKGGYDYESDDSSVSGTVIGFSGGIMHMLSESVGLFGDISYSIENMKWEDEDSESGNEFGISAGLSFFLY